METESSKYETIKYMFSLLDKYREINRENKHLLDNIKKIKNTYMYEEDEDITDIKEVVEEPVKIEFDPSEFEDEDDD